eukprot:jgi/Picre1/27386/NNA_000353.t1
MKRLSIFYLQENRKDEVEELDHIGIDVEDGEFFWAKPPEKLKIPEIGRKKSGKKESKGKADEDEKKKKEEEESPSDPDSGKVTPSSTSDQDSPKVGKEKAIDGDEEGESDDSRIAWLLKNVNLTVNDGELVCVVGKVGAASPV